MLQYMIVLLQVVDMRWGVRAEMTDEHMTTALCMNELRQDTCRMENNYILDIQINTVVH